MTDVGPLSAAIRREEGPDRERRLAELATCQRGVIAYRQLASLGFAAGAIQRRVRAGRLKPLHKGVYAVGHRSLTLHGHWMAAVLACGPGAMLSHRDAAELWGLRESAAAAIDVTAIGRSRHSQPGIRVHRPRSLHPEDRTIRDGIPVTSLARTLLDLAEVLNPRQLDHAVEEAERRRLLDLRAIERLLRRSRGHRGVRPLRKALAGQLPGLGARSELERRFVDLCRDGGLPLPALNTSVERFTVDALWPKERLVVELDSYAFHRTRKAFEGDRERDAVLQLAATASCGSPTDS
ncbi:MAG: type IV toxin-antitoxin system AbiEi family antitoxin domain-containing protein [Thermoleophilaceae bacterium]